MFRYLPLLWLGLIPVTTIAGPLKNARPVTPLSGVFIAPLWSPSGELYCSTPQYDKILKINMVNGLVTDFAAGTGIGFGYIFTPDGSIFCKVSSGADRELWRIGPDGKKTLLAHFAGMSLPEWYQGAVRVFTEEGVLSFNAQGQPDTSSAVGWVYQKGTDLFRVKGQSQPQRMSLQNSEAYLPHQSPDGHRLVYGAQDGLVIVNLDNGCSTSLGIGDHACWSPKGDFIYFDRRRSQGHLMVECDVWRVDRDGKHPENVTSDLHMPVGFPALSADDRWLAFEVHGRIWVGELNPLAVSANATAKKIKE